MEINRDKTDTNNLILGIVIIVFTVLFVLIAIFIFDSLNESENTNRKAKMNKYLNEFLLEKKEDDENNGKEVSDTEEAIVEQFMGIFRAYWIELTSSEIFFLESLKKGKWVDEAKEEFEKYDSKKEELKKKHITIFDFSDNFFSLAEKLGELFKKYNTKDDDYSINNMFFSKIYSIINHLIDDYNNSNFEAEAEKN